MKKEIKVELDGKLYDRLLIYFSGDEGALKQFIIKFLSEALEVEVDSKKPNNSSLDTAGLQNYLKSVQRSSRDYGAKGQGW